jgi:hypothetical protein
MQRPTESLKRWDRVSSLGNSPGRQVVCWTTDHGTARLDRHPPKHFVARWPRLVASPTSGWMSQGLRAADAGANVPR